MQKINYEIWDFNRIAMTNWGSQQLKTMRDKFWSGDERETTQNAFHDLGINPILVDQILVFSCRI